MLYSCFLYSLDPLFVCLYAPSWCAINEIFLVNAERERERRSIWSLFHQLHHQKIDMSDILGGDSVCVLFMSVCMFASVSLPSSMFF